MTRTQLLSLSLFVSMISLNGCQSYRPNTAGGGLLGGATGALLGASIGNYDGKAKEGALIGAVAGGLTGAAIGDQVDQQNARYDQQVYQHALAAQQAAVTLDQIIQMTTSGLSDELIINQVQSMGIAQALTTSDLISLKRNGVSDAVIGTIQAAQLGAQPLPVSSRVAVPVMAPPVYYSYDDCPPRFSAPPRYRHYGEHRHPARRTRGGLSFQF